MHQKATKSYRAALQLRTIDCNNSASRAYYALYQAIVSYLEDEGYKPEDLDQYAKSDDEDEARWRHAWLRKHAEKLLPLTREQYRWFSQAYRVRLKADYLPDDVEPSELKAILDQIPGMFTMLKKVSL